MAIFNESYTNELLNEGAGAVIAIGAGAATIIAMRAVYKAMKNNSMTKFVSGSFKRVKHQSEIVKEALRVFPKMHKDCISLSEFKERLFTISPYSDEPDEEYNPDEDSEKGELDNQLGKIFKHIKIDTTYPNKCVCYFDDNDTMIMYYCYRVTGDYNSTNYKITSFFKDSKVEKYKDYYISHFLSDRGMVNNDCISWANKVLKEYESFNKNED